MTKYRVYAIGRPRRSETIIEAATSFDARRVFAQRNRIPVQEVVGTRYNPPRTPMDRQKVREEFRDAVMAALDRAALDQFGDLETYQTFAKAGAGAWDQDLPELFKGIDRQVDILADRFYVDLTEKEPA